MGSDRARVTYDPSKQYRRVVHQQGRVILEADLNEAQTILSEETRLEALDFVGPVGTPTPDPLTSGSAGFVIGPPKSNTAFDFSVSAGILYVGGLRIELDENVDWSTQPDHVTDAPPKSPGNELAYLELTEQEVS